MVTLSLQIVKSYKAYFHRIISRLRVKQLIYFTQAYKLYLASKAAHNLQ